MTSKNDENSRKEVPASLQKETLAALPKPKRLRVPGTTKLSKACEKILRRDGGHADAAQNFSQNAGEVWWYTLNVGISAVNNVYERLAGLKFSAVFVVFYWS